MMPAGWRLGIWWVLACTAGWAGGGHLGVAVGRSGDLIFTGFTGVVLGGIAAGLFQWLVLRRRIARAGWWLPATIGAGAAVGVVVFVSGLVNRDVGWSAGVGAGGTMLGLMHWLVLRRQVARAGWWVLASTAGWVAGGLLGAVGGWAAIGAVYGAITGPVLVWLLRRPELAESAQE